MVFINNVYQVVSTKSQGETWVSPHPASISLTCLPYLPSRWIHLLVPGISKGNGDAGESKTLFFFVSGVNQRIRQWGWVQDFFE